MKPLLALIISACQEKSISQGISTTFGSVFGFLSLLWQGSTVLDIFTGTIIEAPVGLEDDRGCRTKIDVRVDGDIGKLWQNWAEGLHRQTVYGDIRRELGFFCRFKDIRMIDEAA